MCMTSSLQLFHSTLLPIEGMQGAFCCSNTALEQKDLYGHLWLLTPTLALLGQSCLTLILWGPAHPTGTSLRSSSVAFLSSHCKPETYTTVSGDTEASCLCLGFFSMNKYMHFYNPKGRIRLFFFFWLSAVLFYLQAMCMPSLLSKWQKMGGKGVRNILRRNSITVSKLAS